MGITHLDPLYVLPEFQRNIAGLFFILGISLDISLDLDIPRVWAIWLDERRDQDLLPLLIGTVSIWSLELVDPSLADCQEMKQGRLAFSVFKAGARRKDANA